MANPASKNAVLGRSITFGLSGQGGNIAAYNRDLDTQIESFSAHHRITNLTREPSGASLKHEQYVMDDWECDLTAQQVRSTFIKISKYQTDQRKRGGAVDLLHLTVKTVFEDGSSDVERYVNGVVSDATRKSSTMSKPADSSIKIVFEDMKDS